MGNVSSHSGNDCQMTKAEDQLKIMRPPDCMLCHRTMSANGENVYECDDCSRVVRWMQSTVDGRKRCHAFVVVKKGSAER